MILNDFLQYDNIVVQCHDNPDADTIATGFALHHWLIAQNKSVKLLYSGSAKITKPSLLWMIKLLNIPLQYVTNIEPCNLLITVDCQHGAGNVSNLSSKTQAIIDHHQVEVPLPDLVDIRARLGSCSTIMWDLLRQEEFDFALHPNIYTALYYGLYIDTNNFSEIAHPLDKDMAEAMVPDKSIIKKLKTSIISDSDLTLVGEALLSRKIYGNIGLFRVSPCDPNLLGLIGDFVMQAEEIECSIIFCELEHGVKISVRSTIREIMASEIAVFLTQGLGSGGGNRHKAGGYFNRKGFSLQHSNTAVSDFFQERILAYLNHYDCIYAENHTICLSEMKLFKKKTLPLGYVKADNISPVGSEIIVRTLEGDIDITVATDIYIMIGLYGEVYPINEGKFHSSYEILSTAYNLITEYSPTVINKATYDRIELLPFAKSCSPYGTTKIYASPLVKETKVFTAWDKETYMCGKAGDLLAIRADDHNDVYIIRRDIFDQTYSPIERDEST